MYFNVNKNSFKMAKGCSKVGGRGWGSLFGKLITRQAAKSLAKSAAKSVAKSAANGAVSAGSEYLTKKIIGGRRSPRRHSVKGSRIRRHKRHRHHK